MPNITYVCISDLHLGASNSVLTHLNAEGNHIDGIAPMLAAVLDAVRDLVTTSGTTTRPTLVIHGDLFELALTSLEVAAATFDQLVLHAWGATDGPLFADEVLFVPGNHDHHMWELTREHEYEDDLATAFTSIPAMRHVTSMLRPNLATDDLEPLIQVLARRALERAGSSERPTFRVLYPNLGLVNAGGDRAVVITHGHYLEPMYRAMSFLHNVVTPMRPPRLSIAELEADNWAWIDFFWSTMGRSGDTDDDGGAVPVLYEMLQHETSVDAIIDRVLDDLLPRTRSPIRTVERWVLRRVGNRVAAKVIARERLHPALLSAAATEGLSNYLVGPVHDQLLEEVGAVPRRVDLVFGHTHKPFAMVVRPAGYATPVIAHNTGGWVVDETHPEPLKGASITLISDELEVVDVNVYRQVTESATPRVSVIPVSETREEPSPLRDWLTNDGIVPDAEPWTGLATLAAETVRERQHQLAHRIDVGTAAVRNEPPVGPRGW